MPLITVMSADESAILFQVAAYLHRSDSDASKEEGEVLNVMKVIWIVLSVLAVSIGHGRAWRLNGSPVAVAKSGKITEIIQVVHCLRTADIDWLGDSAVLEKAKVLKVGLRHDRQMYSGKDVVFVVILETPAKGDVFELTREDHKTSRSYRIENNGSFKLGRKGMEWPGEILGGIWTHEYVERNVRKLLKGPRLTISVRAALRPNPVACSSYISD